MANLRDVTIFSSDKKHISATVHLCALSPLIQKIIATGNEVSVPNLRLPMPFRAQHIQKVIEWASNSHKHSPQIGVSPDLMALTKYELDFIRLSLRDIEELSNIAEYLQIAKLKNLMSAAKFRMQIMCGDSTMNTLGTEPVVNNNGENVGDIISIPIAGGHMQLMGFDYSEIDQLDLYAILEEMGIDVGAHGQQHQPQLQYQHQDQHQRQYQHQYQHQHHPQPRHQHQQQPQAHYQHQLEGQHQRQRQGQRQHRVLPQHQHRHQLQYQYYQQGQHQPQAQPQQPQFQSRPQVPSIEQPHVDD